MDTRAKRKIIRGGKIVGKAILVTLAMGGILVAGAVAPNLFIAIQKILDARNTFPTDNQKKREKKVYDTFAYLRKRGLIKMENRGKQLYISLTPEGKRRAKKCQIDFLEIKQTKIWDGKWHIMLFDIQEKKRLSREALRGKLKQLGFYQMQKSVWLHAFPCEPEITILKNFFGLSDSECLCFEIGDLPTSLESKIRMYFGV